MRYFVTAILLAASSTSAFSQESAPMVVGGQPQNLVIRAGTQVTLRTLTDMTTKGKHIKVGDRFSLEVSDPIVLNGQTVIPVGSNAVGEVTAVRYKGMWGKSGNIETRLLYVTANDRKIRLSGSIGDKGVKAGGGAIAASAVVFLPAGFFMTGTSAVIPLGTVVKGIIEEDVPVAFATSAPAPMVVAAPASAQPVATNQVIAAAPPGLTPHQQGLLAGQAATASTRD